MAKGHDAHSATSFEISDDESSIHSSDYGTSSSVDSATHIRSVALSIGASTMLDFQGDDGDEDVLDIQKRWKLKKQEYLNKNKTKKNSQKRKYTSKRGTGDSECSSDVWVEVSDSSWDHDERQNQKHSHRSSRQSAAASRHSSNAQSSRSRRSEKSSERSRGPAKSRTSSEGGGRSGKGSFNSDRSRSSGAVKLEYVDYISKVDVASNNRGISTVGPIGSEEAKSAFFNMREIPHTIAAQKSGDDVSSIGGYSHVHVAMQAYRKKQQEQQRRQTAAHRPEAELLEEEEEEADAAKRDNTRNATQGRVPNSRSSSRSASNQMPPTNPSHPRSASVDQPRVPPPLIPESEVPNPDMYRFGSAMGPARLDANRLEALRMQAHRLHTMPDLEHGIQQRYERTIQHPNGMMMMVKPEDLPLQRTGMELLFVAVISVSLITLVVLLIIMMTQK
ncbi:hypothetical protein FisN_4Hh304 [Fistulifera solaris]|jgi:hypothetical protein|uniref:Uncharacterized protein n=1 Tax=Fistulifera solaris TaxID=1519565 RepID=A0A1Z5KEV8_FISSO|nr:hypothetical protein FisN_4Hh304 [Fistulifera solaris]|eukprot:GAX24746.1 hypothetical protein FisN_4Hh304 [Fistulifera solaris]